MEGINIGSVKIAIKIFFNFILDRFTHHAASPPNKIDKKAEQQEYKTELYAADLNALLEKTDLRCTASIVKNMESNGAMTAKQKKQPNNTCSQFNLFFKPKPPFTDSDYTLPYITIIEKYYNHINSQDALIMNPLSGGDFARQIVLHIHLPENESDLPVYQFGESFPFP